MASDSLLQPKFAAHVQYRADIDGLRAIAVMLVIFFHAFPTTFSTGFIGVDIFFVISGYLISSFIFRGLTTNTFNFFDFYSRRVNRIFPALLLILISLLFLSWRYFIPDDLAKVAKHIFGSSTFLSNLVYLSEAGYFDEAADRKPLLHLWSLGIEEQFYIIWPITLVLAFRFRLDIFKLILVCLLCSFTLNIYRVSYDINFAFFSLQTRAWELLLGALVAFIELRFNALPFKNRSLSSKVSTAGFCRILIGIEFINKDARFPGWWALFPAIGSALIIAAGPQAFINRQLLALTALRLIGLISYPLYLWHWVLLSFTAIVLNRHPNLLMTSWLIALAVVLATATYFLVERPIRQSINNQKTSAFLLALMLGVGSIGLYGYKSQGLLGQTERPILLNETGIYPCKNEFVKKQLCIFGNLQSLEVIFIYGDSHAEHLTAALAKTFGLRYKLIFAYTSSCYFGEHPDAKYKRPSDCDPFVALIHELKAKNEKIIATILGQRWHGYGITTSDQVTTAMVGAMRAFDLNPSKIIIVGSTADVDLHCAKYNYYFQSTRAPQRCEESKSSNKTNGDFVATTSAISAPNNVSFVYPYKVLCPNDRCAPIQNGTLLYGDTHHLTRAGAELIMPAIKEIIEGVDEPDSATRHRN